MMDYKDILSFSTKSTITWKPLTADIFSPELLLFFCHFLPPTFHIIFAICILLSPTFRIIFTNFTQCLVCSFNHPTCFDSEAGKRKKKKGTEPSILVNTKEELVCLTGSGVGSTYLMEFFALQHS